MLAICDNCGKKYRTAPRYYNKAKYHFCSNKCRIEWMKKHPDMYKPTPGKKQDKGMYIKLTSLAKILNGNNIQDWKINLKKV